MKTGELKKGGLGESGEELGVDNSSLYSKYYERYVLLVQREVGL
jgi:hypothetical protein